MTQKNTLNVKLYNKLKPGKKNGTEVTLKLTSNVVGDFNDENNFPHKSLLIKTQVLRLLRETFSEYHNLEKRINPDNLI